MEDRQNLFEILKNRASIRSYKEDPVPDAVVHRLVAAGQRAPFASQTTSIVLTRQRQHIPWGAPAFLLFCLDFHRMERIMSRMGWKMKAHPLWQFFLGVEDAVLCAACLDLAAQAEGLGTCFIGGIPEEAETLCTLHRLPPKVFPSWECAWATPRRSLRLGPVSRLGPCSTMKLTT